MYCSVMALTCRSNTAAKCPSGLRYYDTNEPIYRTEQMHRHREKTCDCQGGEVGEDKLGDLEVSRGKLLLRLEWIDSKVPLYSTGNYIQPPGIASQGKEYTIKMYIGE